MRLMCLLLLLSVGCAPPSPQADRQRQQDVRNFEARMEHNLDRDREYCVSLGGTVVLGKSFDKFYVSHCIIGPNPVIIAGGQK
jgi:hypothetical protein